MVHKAPVDPSRIFQSHLLQNLQLSNGKPPGSCRQISNTQTKAPSDGKKNAALSALSAFSGPAWRHGFGNSPDLLVLRSMTILPSPLAESNLGEKCALYLDHVTEGIPVFLHSLRPRLDPVLTYSATSLRSVAQALPFDADEQTTTVCAAVLFCLLTVAAMSWSNPLSNLWRRSPGHTPAPPQVRDEDFSYITSDDIVEPPSHASKYEGQYGATLEDDEPDIICLRHKGTVYPLRFRAYAIDDGLLTVEALRYEAAATLGVRNPNQIRLLYKGKLLKDDRRLCKEEGLKQHSEVMCVVSEVGATAPSDASELDHGLPRPGSSSSRIDAQEEPAPSSKSKKSKKKKSKKSKGEKPPAPDGFLGTPPVAGTPPSRPASGQSGLPPPSPNLKTLPTAMEQVTALAGYLRTELVPLCDEYVADPPTEPKKREFEYKKLSETILQHVLLKADGIETDGNEAVRNARKALVKETQAILAKLDQVERH